MAESTEQQQQQQQEPTLDELTRKKMENLEIDDDKDTVPSNENGNKFLLKSFT